MQYICIDIGGTSIKYSIMQEDLNILYSDSCDTEAFLGGKAIMQKVFNIIEKCKKKCNPKGICISTAGIVDSETGSIIYANELIPHYTGTKIKELVQNKFNISCEVENDVNCAGLAEANYGAGKKYKTCLCMTIGTGIGGCILSDGKIFKGSGTAGAIGYIQLKNGRFEQLAAASILTKNIAKRKNLDNISGKKVFELYEQQDPICIEEINKMVNYLAEGIANICYIIAPDVIILGGGIMNRFDIIEPLLNLRLKSLLIKDVYDKTHLISAEFKNNAGMLGALVHFLQK